MLLSKFASHFLFGVLSNFLNRKLIPLRNKFVTKYAILKLLYSVAPLSWFLGKIYKYNRNKLFSCSPSNRIIVHTNKRLKSMFATLGSKNEDSSILTTGLCHWRYRSFWIFVNRKRKTPSWYVCPTQKNVKQVVYR